MPSLIAILGLNGSGFKTGLESAELQATRAGRKISSALNEHVTNALVGIAGVAAIEELIRHTIEYASHIADLSQRLGVSTDYLQEMQVVMKENGGTVDDLTAAFERLKAARIAALEGNAKATAAFGKFGIGLETLKTASAQQLLDDIAAKFKASGTNDALSTAFREIGGRGAGVLVPAFMRGLADAREDVRQSGLVMASDTIWSLKDAKDKIEDIAQQLLVDAGPAIVGVLNDLDLFINKIKELSAYLGALTKDVPTSRGGFASAIGGGAVFAFKDYIKSWFTGSALESPKKISEFFNSEAAGQAALDEVNRQKASAAALKKMRDEQAAREAAAVGQVNRPPEHFKAFEKIALNANQQIGAYAAMPPGQQILIDIGRSQLKAMEKTSTNVEKLVNQTSAETDVEF